MLQSVLLLAVCCWTNQSCKYYLQLYNNSSSSGLHLTSKWKLFIEITIMFYINKNACEKGNHCDSYHLLLSRLQVELNLRLWTKTWTFSLVNNGKTLMDKIIGPQWLKFYDADFHTGSLYHICIYICACTKINLLIDVCLQMSWNISRIEIQGLYQVIVLVTRFLFILQVNRTTDFAFLRRILKPRRKDFFVLLP